MASVLIGIDGSPDSRAALRFGAALARSLGAQARAVWAWQYPSDTVTNIGRLELPEPAEADRIFTEQLDRLVEEELGEDAPLVDLEVARGTAVNALLYRADAASMIVVGSRGLGGFRGLLLGSVSRQLTEHAHVPVTIVRGAADTLDPTPQRILVGHDGSGHAARALRFAMGLAVGCDATLTVVYATGPDVALAAEDVERYIGPAAVRETVEGWCEPLRDAGMPYDIEILDGDARTALLHAADDRNADLIVVGSRGHGPVAKLLLGSVTTSIVQHSEIPVMVVPREA